uniref:VTT domain-containing protein n=1 Tax=Brassica oleracea var. oleracea TaxID=109376 RepID=A0A0D3DEP8_BRAOL
MKEFPFLQALWPPLSLLKSALSLFFLGLRPSLHLLGIRPVARRKDGLLNYMLFLRLTPTLPNTFINVASPIVDVPYHIFFLATFIGLIPAAFVTVRAGIALGELQSLGDLYDFSSMATLFLIGVLSVTPTLISKKKA